MNAVGQVLATCFLVVVLAVEVLVTPRLMARLKARIAAGDASARLRMYRLIVLTGWPLAALALVVLLVGGLSLHEIGFAAPHLRPSDHVTGGLIVGAVVGLLANTVALAVSARASARGSAGRPAPRLPGDSVVLLPQSPRERGWYAAVSVTAGITEEISYRALPIQLLLALLPWHNRFPAVLIGALVFGLCHRYQGWTGMLATAAVGLLLGWVYVATGSLGPSMLLHVVIDLRFLAVRAGNRSEGETDAAGLPVLRSRVDGRPLRVRAPDQPH